MVYSTKLKKENDYYSTDRQQITKGILMKKIITYIATVFVLVGCNKPGNQVQNDYLTLADTLEKSLNQELLDAWYPKTIDSVYGGFMSNFSWDWQPSNRQGKMIVTQSRHVWTASQIAMFYNSDRYREIAKHGFEFLRDKMWDYEQGGFFTNVDQQGNPMEDSQVGFEKRAYGNTFAIYGLTAYYNASGDTAALNLALKTFNWLETHSHDAEYGGYFDLMLRDGSWTYKTLTPELADKGEFGRAQWKDFNSSIHLLEAFTDLYKASKNELVKQRLEEMLLIVRDKMAEEKGYLTLYFDQDWTPFSLKDSSEIVSKELRGYDVVSFGHNVETAFLILEASAALEIENDSISMKIAKNLVDHSLKNGWDEQYGGFFYEGYYTSEDSMKIYQQEKSWWTQAEGLNALLLMSKLFPEEKIYYESFLKQWEQINTYQIDHQNKDWYNKGLDRDPDAKEMPKAGIWKGNYHNARALINCIKMLRGESELVNELTQQ